MHKFLNQFLESFSLFSESEKQSVMSCYTEMRFPAKYEIVPLDKKTDSLYFIQQGCIRKYCYKEGTPFTLHIFQEHEFAVEYVAFTSEEKSTNILETIEDCKVFEIKKQHLEQLYVDVPKMNFLMRKALEKVIYKVHTQLNDFIMLSPEERYKKLTSQNPQLILRIPQHIIASYIGVSTTSLSRIRKRLIKN